MGPCTPDSVATAVIEAAAAARSIPPFGERCSGFDLPLAYAAAREVRRRRVALGARTVGRKIGFTNSAIWGGHGLSGPIWNYMFDDTVHRLTPQGARFALPDLPEMRIEPELAFRFHADPSADMDDAALLGCIDWIAHGFEIVFSPYPHWRFSAADAVAAFGVHAALVLGPPAAIAPMGADLAAALRLFRVTLRDDSGTVRDGCGANVLGSPLEAIRFLLRTLAADPAAEPLAAGEIVTTGTLTEAMPVAAGDRWRTAIDGLPLPGLDVRFA